MSNLITYKSNESLKLGEFLQKTFVLDRIDKTDKTLALNSIYACIAENAVHLNIKDLNKAILKDIAEMIFMRFKELSLDEVHYAFKLYRYGVIANKLQSYGQFNTMFTQKLLSEYKTYKSNEIKRRNLSKEKSKAILTDQEKIKVLKNGVYVAYKTILEGGTISIGFHLYDFINSLGLIEVSKEQKAMLLDMARLSLVGDANDKRERGIKFDLKKEINRINTTLDNDVIQRAKTKTFIKQLELWKNQKLELEELKNKLSIGCTQ